MASVADELTAEIARYDEISAGLAPTRSGVGMAAVAEAISAARLASGLDRAAMAGKLGVTAAEYGRWEDQGFHDTPFHRLDEVAGHLGMTLAVTPPIADEVRDGIR